MSSAFKLGGKREGSCEDPDKQIREQWRCVLCVRAQVCVYGSESVWDLTPQGQCIGSGIAMGFLDLLIGSDEAREQIQPCAPVCVCACVKVCWQVNGRASLVTSCCSVSIAIPNCIEGTSRGKTPNV